ncbi:MAG: MerR family regulatory protein [Marmoricola sp.]|nr:MerR family regulatory protein [Marmoricola sp.]
MSGPPSPWSVDELAGLVGLTVRTTRYYASLGLIPPPSGRRGRISTYDDRHRIRLMMIRTMQDRGFSLTGIEQQLRRIRPETEPEELELRLALVSSWAPAPPEVLDRAELEERAERVLSDEDLGVLEQLGALRPVEHGYEIRPTFEVGVGLLDLKIPLHATAAAGTAIREAMDDLARRLNQIMRTEVIAPFREHNHELTDGADLEDMMSSLRRLTLDAVVANFQAAANKLTDTTGS